MTVRMPVPFDRFPELTALATYRVEQDLTYRGLAAQVGISYRTLYSLLNDPAPRPYERSLYKVRAFLARVAAAPTRRRSRSAEATR